MDGAFRMAETGDSHLSPIPLAHPHPTPEKEKKEKQLMCGMYVVVAVEVQFPRSEDRDVLSSYCHGTKQYRQVPQELLEEAFCCSAPTLCKQKYFYLLCNVLAWKLAVPSPSVSPVLWVSMYWKEHVRVNLKFV